jgi:hypothetical protein
MLLNYKIFTKEEDIYLYGILIKLYPHLKTTNNVKNFEQFISKLDRLLSLLSEKEYYGFIDNFTNTISIRLIIERVINQIKISEIKAKLADLTKEFDKVYISKTVDCEMVIITIKEENLKWMATRIPINSNADILNYIRVQKGQLKETK